MANNQEEMSIEEYRQLAKGAKYQNKKVTVDNIEFDSIAEAARYTELRLMEKAGAISDLRLQPEFQLQRAFTDNDGVKHRSITYIADFMFTEASGLRVVEDVKGHITKEYAIKKKLFLFKYFDLTFREIKAK